MYEYANQLPPQKIPFSEKDKDWRERCVQAIMGLGNSLAHNGRTTRNNKLVNYNIINSIFDPEEFVKVLNPYGLDTTEYGLPQDVRPLNSIVSKFNNVVGEELKRPFKFTVIAKSGEILNKKNKERKEAILDNLQSHLYNSLVKAGKIKGDEEKVPEPEEIRKYYSYGYSDIKEQQANEILEYLKEKEDLVLKFSQGFEHAYIVAEEFYCISINNGNPKVRVVNPVFFDYDKTPDSLWVQKSKWAREIRYMASSDILDEYGEFLTEEQIERLDLNTVTNFGTINSNFSVGFESESDLKKATDFNLTSPYASSGSHLQVATVYWKSLTEVTFVTYKDENGDEQVKTVFGDYKLTKEDIINGVTKESRWINEVWEGTKIGGDIFINIHPIENQFRTQDNISECELPYVGRIYDNINSVATSQVDRLKPIQYLKLTIYSALERELSKAKGKIVHINAASIPKGWDMDKWLYYVSTFGINFYNGNDEAGGGVQTANNLFGSVDLTLSNNISFYISLIDKLDREMDSISGITPERLGTMTNDTSSSNSAAISQSYNNTERLFYYHNEVKKEVLEHLLHTAACCYKNKKIQHQLVVDDIYPVFNEIDGGIFQDSDFGVFVSNSSRDALIMQQITSLAPTAIQQDKLTLQEFITILKSQSISEISHTLIDGDKAKREQVAQQQQAQQQQAEVQSQLAQARLDQETVDKQLDRENKIAIAEINAGSRVQMPTMEPITPDNTRELDLKQGEINTKYLAEQQRTKTQAEIDMARIQLEIKKLEVDMRSDDIKLAIAKENKTKAELARSNKK